MQSNQLLLACLHALNQIPNQHDLNPVPGGEGKLKGFHTSYDLAAAVGAHIRANKGFTVILGYPDNDSGETYSSTSDADTWEAAVKEVAEEMLEDQNVTEDGELSIVDVLEGKEHVTYPDVDRYAVVRFEDGKARILGQNGEDRS